jgi:hypothetical protein
MIFSAIKNFGWIIPLLEFSVGPAVGVRLGWFNWVLVGVHPKNIYCVWINGNSARAENILPIWKIFHL